MTIIQANTNSISMDMRGHYEQENLSLNGFSC
jgi:hypothetical protein